MPREEVNVRQIAGQWVDPVALSWYLHDTEIDPPHVEDEPPALPRAGDRLIWGNGARYVVEEVWQSFEKHGGLSRGHHVFLREATVEEDRPLRLNASYFGHQGS